MWEKLIEIYPDLTDADFGQFGTISLQDDSDGFGPFIAKWQHVKPLPKGFKVGK